MKNIILSLLLVLVVVAGCATPQKTVDNQSITPTTSLITYITNDLEQCKLIKYMCVQGKEPFSDAGGCGCRPIGLVTPDMHYVSHNVTQCAATTFMCDASQENFFSENGCGCKDMPTTDGRVYCTAESREVAGCNKMYLPVCGMYNSNIQCIKAPCGITAGNACEACQNPDVSYYVEGTCDTQKEGDLLDSSKMCTMQYDPVCASFNSGATKTAGNACEASNWYGVVSTSAGECNSGKKQAFDCTAQQIADQDSVVACTMEYAPVCGQMTNGSKIEAGNKCSACATKGVISYTQGVC